MLWSVYITIGNLDLKTWYNQTQLGTLLFGLISIVYKWSKDKDNKDKDLKVKIYHLVLKIILQCKCPSSTYSQLNDNNILNIVFQEIYEEGIKIQCANSFKQCYYLLFMCLIVD